MALRGAVGVQWRTSASRQPQDQDTYTDKLSRSIKQNTTELIQNCIIDSILYCDYCQVFKHTHFFKMDSEIDDTETASSHTDASPRTSIAALAKRRPMPRKGHRKSRNGCISCKRRKVKCDEAIPKCRGCVRLELDCMYDEKKKENEAKQGQVVVMTRPLSVDPSWFNINDIRFFQHFTFTAYPMLPLDGWPIWQEVSQMAHEVDDSFR